MLHTGAFLVLLAAAGPLNAETYLKTESQGRLVSDLTPRAPPFSIGSVLVREGQSRATASRTLWDDDHGGWW